VVVLTSKAGSTAARDANVAGDEARLGEIYVQAARQLLRPELLNGLDDVVLFLPLSQESIERIVDLQLARATRRLDAWGRSVGS
jgi:ATP-dependent Clp protease ATP-binding subunit ClpB